MPGTMKITRSESKKTPGKILRIEGDNCFVFIAHSKKNSVYLNVGGKIFWVNSESPVALVAK